MKLRFYLLLILTIINYISFAQMDEVNKWKGYINYKVDTIVEDYRFKGEFINQQKQGFWQIFYNNNLIQNVAYHNDIITQIEGMDNGVHYRAYYDEKGNESLIRAGNDNRTFISFTSNDKDGSIQKNVWYTNSNKILLDTSFGLKKIDNNTFIDRNNNTYTQFSSSIKISEHELLDEQIIINDEGNYVFKRKKLKLFNNRKMSLINDELKEYFVFGPTFTTLSKDADEYSLKSSRRDVVSLNHKTADSTYYYEVSIGNKPVLKGYLNKDGRLNGKWEFYHFQYFDANGKQRTAAFGGANLYEYSKYVQGDAPYINFINFKSLAPSKVSDITSEVTNDYLQSIEKVFTSIDEPYLFSKFAAYAKIGNGIELKDNLGYHLFQSLEFSNGDLKKGYMFFPDGKVCDSINLNKDDFGEQITKNSKFKGYPEHAMSQAYQKQLVDGVRMVMNVANSVNQEKSNEQWKNIKCSHCNKPLESSTAIVVDGITCGNTTYPGGGNFCSNKCRFDYELGYCRNK